VNTSEHPSGKPSGRTITIHLTRDTLMLVSALFFLIIAISLAFIFPSARTTDTVVIDATASALHIQGSAPDAATVAPVIGPAAHALMPQAQIEPVLTPSVHVAQVESPAYPAPQTANAHTDSASGSAAANAVLPSYPAPQAADGGANLPIFDPTSRAQNRAGAAAGEDTIQQPTEAPSFMAVSPNTPRSPTLSSNGVSQPAAPAAPDAKVKPQAATKPAAPASDGGSPPAVHAATKPKPPPMTILRGSQHWATSPMILRNTYRLLSSATLTIDPGVEVQVAPGASLFVEGTLFALGTADRPVRFVGINGKFWESIIGTPGSNIDLEHTEIHGGGGGGTLISSDSGNVVVQNGHITGNGGHIVAKNSRVNIRNTEITDNDMPYGAALEVIYTGAKNALDELVLNDNRIIRNQLSAGTVPVQVTNDRPLDSIVLDIQRNLLIGQDGPDLTLIANGLLQGNITCNALVGGANGLSVRSNQPQTFHTLLNIRDNAIEQHIPPLDPFYRQNNIGRGATSEIPLKMDANWWGNPLGPYVADRHADGRGDAVGANISFDAWHTARPACAPTP
jgi:hypothetical protein